jgi:ferrous iron transport protein B
VVALNKTDINEKKQNQIDGASLSRQLSCPVVETVSTHGSGMKEVVEAAIAQLGKKQKAPLQARKTPAERREFCSS